jgi:hypothetical protein
MRDSPGIDRATRDPNLKAIIQVFCSGPAICASPRRVKRHERACLLPRDDREAAPQRNGRR